MGLCLRVLEHLTYLHKPSQQHLIQHPVSSAVAEAFSSTRAGGGDGDCDSVVVAESAPRGEAEVTMVTVLTQALLRVDSLLASLGQPEQCRGGEFLRAALNVLTNLTNDNPSGGERRTPFAQRLFWTVYMVFTKHSALRDARAFHMNAGCDD